MPSPNASPAPDVLSRKRRPTRTYRMAVDDPGPAEEALQRAQLELRTARLRRDSEQVAAAQRAVNDATARLEACWERVQLKSIGGRFLSLMREHPPTDEQKAEGAEWDPDTFQPALIAAATHDEFGMTAEQWTAELAGDQWSVADRNELFNLALDANVNSRELVRRHEQRRNLLSLPL